MGCRDSAKQDIFWVDLYQIFANFCTQSLAFRAKNLCMCSVIFKLDHAYTSRLERDYLLGNYAENFG